MRRLLLPLALAALALPAAPAAAAAPKLRCAKGAKLQRDAKHRPVACLPAKLPTAEALTAGLERAARAELRRRVRKGKGPRVAAREVGLLARRVADPTQPMPGTAVQAWFDDLGEPESHVRDPRTGNETMTWTGSDGTSTVATGRHDGPPEGQVGYRSESVIHVRERHGGGRAMGLLGDERLARCPTATGEAAGTFAYGLTVGLGEYAHGKRTWKEVVARVESPLTGHVSTAAKAETFDVDLRVSVETRGWVEIAATGKVAKHLPTRTMRMAYTAKGLPVGADLRGLLEQLLKTARFRGPHGSVSTSQAELDDASGIVTVTGVALAQMQQRLEDGDNRWYEQRQCAKLDVSSTPAKLHTGDTATWDVQVLAADGTPPAKTSAWTVRSACDGTLTASQADGARGHFEVSGGAWRADPDHHACLDGELTSTAGRPPVLQHPIYAEDPPKGYAFTIKVDYTKTMGPGIAATELHASGTVSDKPDDRSSEGEGAYAGSEWDGSLTNTCGQDMLKVRSIAGPAITGADIHPDGTVTIALTATDRPLDFSWIVVVPVEGGTQEVKADNPFCGEPGLAKSRAVVTVTSRPLED